MSFKPFKKLALASAFALSFMFNSVARAEEAPAVTPPAPQQAASEVYVVNGQVFSTEREFMDALAQSLYSAPVVAHVATECQPWNPLPGEIRQGCYLDAEGTAKWYNNNLLDREDGPAVEKADGTKMWYRYGLEHREDGPAAEDARGNKVWYHFGQRHRDIAISKITYSFRRLDQAEDANASSKVF